jgi:hypothetical protein
MPAVGHDVLRLMTLRSNDQSNSTVCGYDDRFRIRIKLIMQDAPDFDAIDNHTQFSNGLGAVCSRGLKWMKELMTARFFLIRCGSVA